MKTKLAIMAIALLTMQAASAQFRLGAKAGANLVKVDGKSFKDEFRYGYHLGGFAEIGLTRDKSLLYSPKFYSANIQQRLTAVSNQFTRM